MGFFECQCWQGPITKNRVKLIFQSLYISLSLKQALLNYVSCGFRIDVYWKTLNAKGLTKDKLASYDRPIVSEPCFKTDAKEGLIRDLTSYLRTLKVYGSIQTRNYHLVILFT